MKNNIKKLIALCLSCILVASIFASCGEDASEDRGSSRHKTKQEETEDKKGINSFIPEIDVSGTDEPSKQECWIAQTFSEVTDLLDIDVTTFNEGYAFVRVKKEKSMFYIIDKTGNIKVSLGSISSVVDNLCFHNGLSFVEEYGTAGYQANNYLIDTEGNKYTAEDFGGTALGTTKIDREMLEGGYFVVDKITSTFDGATYEAAIYNTAREQIQPYSEELYELLHDGYNLQFYNGYIIENETQTYHIATGTYGEYKDLSYVHKMDLAHHSSGGHSGKSGMYRDDVLLLDLSRYETLINVEYIGDNGIALFSNEENEYYFSVMDTEGNLKFDPIYYGKRNNCSINFNGSVILTKTFLDQPDGKMLVQMKTYDLEGKEMGTLEMTKTASAFSYINTDFGIDTIVIEHSENNTIGYYDMNLKPMFSAE